MVLQDRRVKRTQQHLAKALVALTLEKGYDNVTIRDITERADIGYATFFRHYRDKEALLHDVSEVVLSDLRNVLPLGPVMDATLVGTSLFNYVAEHANVFSALVSSHRTSSLLQHIVELAYGDILNEKTLKEGSLVPIEVAAYHIATSSIALVQWWLERDMPYPPERMGVIFDKLIVQPTFSITFNEPFP
jgi:AcrR family transcriptional regulator